jgi:hypothetical protein
MIDEKLWAIIVVFAFIITEFLDFAGWIPVGVAMLAEEMIFLGTLLIMVLLLGEIRDAHLLQGEGEEEGENENENEE